MSDYRIIETIDGLRLVENLSDEDREKYARYLDGMWDDFLRNAGSMETGQE